MSSSRAKGLIIYSFMHGLFKDVDLDRSVGIGTRYGLDVPGIESRWGEIFRIRPERTLGPSSLLYSRYRVFLGGKAAWEWR